MKFRVLIVHLLFILAAIIAVILNAKASPNYQIEQNQRIQKDGSDSATVYISFVVERDGRITNARVHKVDCNKCSRELVDRLKAESVKVVASGPAMNPGKKRRRFIQPMKFIITER